MTDGPTWHSEAEIEDFTRGFCIAAGVSLKNVCRVLRIALTGTSQGGISVFTMMAVLGRDEVDRRLAAFDSLTPTS